MEQRLRDARNRPVVTALAATCALLGAVAAAWAPGAEARLPHPLTLRPGPKPVVQDTSFVLPPGSAQRRTGWYELRLRARVVFGFERGRGNAYLSADTNGRTAAQIRFRSRGRARPVEWDAVGIIDGTQRGLLQRSTLITFRNFVQDKGIRGGANTLSFRIETFGRAGLERATVLPGSGVYRTSSGPARVVLDVRQRGALRAGKPATVELVVRNTGMRPARQIRVGLDDAAGLRLTLESHRPFSLAPGEAKILRAIVRAEKPGSYRVTFAADASSNAPAATIELQIAPRADGGVRAMITIAAVTVMGMISLVLLVGGRRR